MPKLPKTALFQLQKMGIPESSRVSHMDTSDSMNQNINSQRQCSHWVCNLKTNMAATNEYSKKCNYAIKLSLSEHQQPKSG